MEGSMMNIPKLRMESQFAKINMNQTPAMLDMEQPKATMSIEQPKATMHIQTTKGKLTIDQSQAWEEMNLETTARLIENHAAESRSIATEGTARRAEQGAELINIESGVDIIAEQGETYGQRAMKTLSVKYIPSPFAVKISYERGEADIHFQANKPIIDVDIHKPIVNFTRGQVNIAMEQYASLDISVVDSNG